MFIIFAQKTLILKKGRKPESFIKKPTYKGGNKALTEFIMKNLRFPEQAIAQNIEGIVRLKIDIDRNGKVLKAHIISGIGYGCDEEAIRVAKLLRFEIDAPKTGHIIYHKNLNIPFKISVKAPVLQYKYEITKSEKKPTKDSKPPTTKKTSIYQYSIPLNP